MRVLLVTLMHRRLAPAMESVQRALLHLETYNPQIALDYLQLYGDTPYSGGYANVVHKYRRAQQQFLAGDWDVFVSVEDDMLIQVDTFPRLLTLLHEGADIGYGLYVWRHNNFAWSAYSALDEHAGTSFSARPERARRAWGEVRTVVGVGMGCTAIKRQVLQRLAFRRGGGACNDWYLALDAQQVGYIQRCDLGLVCGHMAQEPTPRVYWPDPDEDALYRVEMWNKERANGKSHHARL